LKIIDLMKIMTTRAKNTKKIYEQKLNLNQKGVG